ncbi:hypothetical protein [Pleionea sp. CnH1-48]|uniref:hypothetical protein n=1 Tax=Pleionea sp. CnH1-48 TaxID=2954494 RepID=UPI0020973986|nr:hypothetical protein [Pleionea sp. CnH1-48]MCO7224568.1 hypothetical protein [Pleionea sp. CnH1-48]
MKYSKFEWACIGFCLLYIVIMLPSAMSGEAGWSSIGFFVLCAVIIGLSPKFNHWFDAGKRQWVEFDEDEIRRFRGDSLVESIQWNNIAEISVSIESHSEKDLVNWIFITPDNSKGCVVPNDVEGFTELLLQVEKLPRFDKQKVIDDINSRGDESWFNVWQRDEKGK